MPGADAARIAGHKRPLIATARDAMAVDNLDLDETSARTSRACIHGATLTCLAALTPTRLRAPFVLEGAME